MKQCLFMMGCFFFTLVSVGQISYKEDAKTAYETIRTNAFKNSYQYVITYDDVFNASMFVKASTDYMIFFVYDNTDHPLPKFKAFLMTPDNEVKKRYTSRSIDIGQIGAARVAQIKFSTKKFTGDKNQFPVKLEAAPKAKIYIFERKNDQ